MSFGNGSSDNFDLESYKKVNERLSDFRKEHPQGQISSFRTETKDGVSFKTIIVRNYDEAIVYAQSSIAASTGHSFLPNYARDNDKVEEYAETVSVGRALAMLGYGVEKSIASSEEMSQFQRNTQARKANVKAVEAAPAEEASQEESSTELPKLKTARPFKRASRFSK